MNNDAFIPATGFVVSAIAGWAFYVRGRHWLGNAMLAASVAGLWSLAVLYHQPLAILHSARIAHRQSSTLHASELSANRGLSTVWVSTLDRNKKVYHRPTCHYVTLMDKNADGESHKKPLIELEAIAAGYQPCSKCFSTEARLATQLQPQ